MHTKKHRVNLGVVLYALASIFLYFGLPHAQALAGNYTICIMWEIQTNDSCNDPSCGIPAGANMGGYEDIYASANTASTDVVARGVRVRMARTTPSVWSDTFDTGTDGCFSFTDIGASYTATIYGYSTNDNGTYARIHDDPGDFSAYPGGTYSIGQAMTPTGGSVNTYYVGSSDRKWTTMAALGYTIMVWSNQLDDMELHVGLDEGECFGGSAHFPSSSCSGGSCPSNDDITLGRHYLWIAATLDSCAEPVAMSKFAVAHEAGHAIAALWYGSDGGADGGEPGQDWTLSTSGACYVPGLYSIFSKEWNNIGFREGFAHFIAARVWNNKASEAAFTWFGVMNDMERWGEAPERQPVAGSRIVVIHHGQTRAPTRTGCGSSGTGIQMWTGSVPTSPTVPTCWSSTPRRA